MGANKVLSSLSVHGFLGVYPAGHMSVLSTMRRLLKILSVKHLQVLASCHLFCRVCMPALYLVLHVYQCNMSVVGSGAEARAGQEYLCGSDKSSSGTRNLAGCVLLLCVPTPCLAGDGFVWCCQLVFLSRQSRLRVAILCYTSPNLCCCCMSPCAGG